MVTKKYFIFPHKRLGFELRCHFHGAEYTETRVNFKRGPIDNGKKMVEYIREDMRVRLIPFLESDR
jgi:hypothetical protein